MNKASRRDGRARGLYLLTPDVADTAALLARVAPLLPFATWLQYRNKPAPHALQRDQLLALKPLCEHAGVPLLVNDDWPLAAELDLAGAHLGRDDGDIRQARAALGPDALLGASCYDDAGRARAAVQAGASYVAFGAFFPSPTKPHAHRADVRLFADTAALGVPRVAIGGITPDNGGALVQAGADLLAVISAVFAAADPVAAARACLHCFEAQTTLTQYEGIATDTRCGTVPRH